jgi:hypothetical protein
MDEPMKYKVTIEWQALGFYEVEVYADSEAEAIAEAKEMDDDDLQAQMSSYTITGKDAEHIIECDMCEDTGVVRTDLGPDEDDKPCPECQ